MKDVVIEHRGNDRVICAPSRYTKTDLASLAGWGEKIVKAEACDHDDDRQHWLIKLSVKGESKIKGDIRADNGQWRAYLNGVESGVYPTLQAADEAVRAARRKASKG